MTEREKKLEKRRADKKVEHMRGGGGWGLGQDRARELRAHREGTVFGILSS